MKKIIKTSTAAFLAIAIAVAVYSCKKANDTTTTADDTASQTTTASDDARVNNELENASSDANSALSSSSTISGKLTALESTISLPCDVKMTIDSTKGVITLTYDSSTCYGYYLRYGTIIISLNNYVKGTWHWKNAGSTVQLSFVNYRVKRVSDGKSITFNGTKSIENYSGGLVGNLTVGTSVTHYIRAKGLTITFDDGKVRTWSVHRNKTWSMPNTSEYQVSISSDTTVNGYPNAVMWGTTRLGISFTNQITSPIVCNTVCGWYEPTSGVHVVNGLSRSLTETFGVNSDGTPNTTSNCAYGYKFNWTNASGVARQVVLPY